MDPFGTVLVMGTVISFLLGIHYGGATDPWNSSTVIGLLVGSGLMLIAFGILEFYQSERAMLAPRLMRRRNVWLNGVYGFFFAGSYFVPLYYLPIYFQSIDNATPIGSGVRNLPLIIAFSIATIISGGIISKTGIATPLLPVGSVIATIAAGLLYTLEIGTKSGKWIGYQILAGAGYGLAFQVPIIMCQGTSDASDLASVTAIILCKFSFVFSHTSHHLFLSASSPVSILSLTMVGLVLQSFKRLVVRVLLELRKLALSIRS